MKKDSKKDNKIEKKDTGIFNDKVLTVMVIILVIMSIVIVVIKIINRNNLDTESELVTELHNYFSTEDIGDCEGLLVYAEDKIEYDDIKAETRACLAYQHATIPEKVETDSHKTKKNKNTCDVDGMIFRADDDTNKCEVRKIEKSIIDNSYKKIFGKDIEDIESFKIDNTNICYAKDDYYYCGLSETFTYTLGNEVMIYRVTEKAVEKGSEIVITDYFVKLSSDTCFKNYTTSTINENCTDEYKKLDDKKDLNYKFMKNYGTEYKHVYKKGNDDTYYWVSSEPVK